MKESLNQVEEVKEELKGIFDDMDCIEDKEDIISLKERMSLCITSIEKVENLVENLNESVDKYNKAIESLGYCKY